MYQLTPFVALLRGINVGGRNRILMADLRSGWDKVGLTHVATYLQSGNMVFLADHRLPVGALSTLIVQQLKERFDLEVPVVVCRGDTLLALAEQPLPEGEELRTHHITFLASPAATTDVKKIAEERYLQDTFSVNGAHIRLRCPGGYGRTKLNNAFWERHLKRVATTRNMRSVRALATMVQSLLATT